MFVQIISGVLISLNLFAKVCSKHWNLVCTVCKYSATIMFTVSQIAKLLKNCGFFDKQIQTKPQTFEFGLNASAKTAPIAIFLKK